MPTTGLQSKIEVADSDFSEDAGYRGAARLLRGRRPVTAIAAVNDLSAVGAMSAVADAGLRVPGDVAITGYDDTFVSAIRQVSLTSVNPDSSSIGSLAAHCRAPSDRGSRTARRGAPAAPSARDPVQLRRPEIGWLRSCGRARRWSTCRHKIRALKWYGASHRSFWLAQKTWNDPTLLDMSKSIGKLGTSRAEYRHAFDLDELLSSSRGNARLRLVWATAVSKSRDSVLGDQPQSPSMSSWTIPTTPWNRPRMVIVAACLRRAERP
jgi:hypothetical protein